MMICKMCAMQSVERFMSMVNAAGHKFTKFQIPSPLSISQLGLANYGIQRLHRRIMSQGHVNYLHRNRCKLINYNEY